MRIATPFKWSSQTAMTYRRVLCAGYPFSCLSLCLHWDFYLYPCRPCAWCPDDANHGDFTSVIGMSLVRNQGFKNFCWCNKKWRPVRARRQKWLRVYRWSSLAYCSCCRGFHRFSRPSPFVTAGAKHLTLKLLPHLRFSRMPGGGFSAGTGGGETFDGEYQRKDDDRDRIEHKDDRRD